MGLATSTFMDKEHVLSSVFSHCCKKSDFAYHHFLDLCLTSPQNTDVLKNFLKNAKAFPDTHI